MVAACRLSYSMACGILFPRPGIEPESPALQGEFLTTGLPEKSLSVSFCLSFLVMYCLPVEKLGYMMYMVFHSTDLVDCFPLVHFELFPFPLYFLAVGR